MPEASPFAKAVRKPGISSYAFALLWKTPLRIPVVDALRAIRGRVTDLSRRKRRPDSRRVFLQRSVTRRPSRPADGQARVWPVAERLAQASATRAAMPASAALPQARGS